MQLRLWKLVFQALIDDVILYWGLRYDRLLLLHRRLQLLPEAKRIGRIVPVKLSNMNRFIDLLLHGLTRRARRKRLWPTSMPSRGDPILIDRLPLCHSQAMALGHRWVGLCRLMRHRVPVLPEMPGVWKAFEPAACLFFAIQVVCEVQALNIALCRWLLLRRDIRASCVRAGTIRTLMPHSGSSWASQKITRSLVVVRCTAF